MASPPNEDGDFGEEEEDDEVEDGTEASQPCAVASQVKRIAILEISSQLFFIKLFLSTTNLGE